MRIATFTFLLLLSFNSAFAATLFGKVDAVSGHATLADSDGISTPLAEDEDVFEGETITTANDGEIHISTVDGAIIALRPNTIFRVDAYQADGEDADKITMSLLVGTLRSITGWIGKHNPAGYRINTPNAAIGIRGTDHEVSVIEESFEDEAGTYDTVSEGATFIATPQGEAEVHSGGFAFAPKYRTSPPVLLASRPNFWTKRQLRIEERIQKRKEFLRDKLEELRNERKKLFKALRAEKAKDHRQEKPNGGHSKDLRQQKRQERREKWQERKRNHQD